MRIDLNCDLGESFGAYRIGSDREILPLISSANAACGFHASDPLVMQKTAELARQAGIQVGAHPGYPDLQGFGRRNMSLSAAEVYADVLYQIGALDAFLKVNGMKLQHVKPHGALYNTAATDRTVAEAICRAVRDYDPSLIVLALSGGQLYHAAKELGLRAAAEVFADRAYEEDGTLVSRRKPGAVLTDEDFAIARTVRMIREGVVTAVTGRDIPITVDSVCIHGDNEKALLFARRMREAFVGEGIEILPLKDLV